MNNYNFLYNDIENCQIIIPSNTSPYNARTIQPIVLPFEIAKIGIDEARYYTVTNLAIFCANYASLKGRCFAAKSFYQFKNPILRLCKNIFAVY